MMDPAKEGQTLTLPDGRKLGYLTVGEGKPVFYFHGIPSSRLDVLFLTRIASTRKLQVIGVDRPGFGLSTYKKMESLSSFASDLNYLANNLSINKFAILGWSMGGPWAISYAAQYPEFVSKILVVGSPSLPIETEMEGTSNTALRLGFRFPGIAKRVMRERMEIFLRADKDLTSFKLTADWRKLLDALPDADAKFNQDESFTATMIHSNAEAYRQKELSIEAQLREMQLTLKPWDTPLSKIPADLLHIWHGTEDRNVPVDNAYLNAKRIPGSTLIIFEGKGHWLLLDNLEKMADLLNS